ncbi:MULTISPECIES: lipoprotein-releasing ABC transporter permease subunit [Pseudorhizobium]|uniref:Multidrug ABC transporter substrate-binding protein n=1 Tax=Pseudorhizobium pelagicum TaxID=1509405 RepID=A0A922T7R9_9HYPH|nr:MULTISPECIES: lipoprotein-releasing ABC transporter permease subunit [Pseudorhizobium]MBU1317480.1 lipoprotein-releasing ABC transporter permease subunit [Alphaproteobacteria bacterium]MDY6962134.1 lipoprotein-releasing ABC transporter permease subunit [Pseudomonadota bacterium]KEQ06826.1 multidrug ABC transporter substrate-binding protein [Pseudorhizobium pelagicum]KEQ08669.1 multidrug ABC transporter substrate-binding protein [Pseudorhizobium pelagicum]MBU1551912.1 lipoprotein-releasing A|tara:strand:- start:7396 stop:8700 length:1305 start_codon:yes stop_codon:yes gene_type:complete
MASAADRQTEKMDLGPSAAPFSAFERMVAWRYLRSRRKEAFISVIAGFSFIGIMLGVATLIIVMAVMNGFRTELISRILGINGHMIVQPIDGPLTDYADLAVKFEAVPGVKMALPLVEGQTLASGRAGAGSGALVRGIRAEDLEKLPQVAGNIRQGDIVGFASGQGVLVGSRLAASLGITAGDDITLISPEGDVTPMGVNPRVKAYPVSGVFEIGMSEYDATIIYMPLEEAQLYFNADGLVQSIELFVDDPDNVDGLRPLVEAAAGRQVHVTDWRQRNQTFFSALQVERNVMFMILTLIVLVAALNIISGLIMLVKDKGSDIAILRTMGAGSGAIMRIFFMTGAAIGTVGTFAGVVLGVVVCLNIESIRQFFSWLSGTVLFDPELYFLSQLPAEMSFGETFTVVVMALVLSFLATIFPAWRASKLDPVQALRYE